MGDLNGLCNGGDRVRGAWNQAGTGKFGKSSRFHLVSGGIEGGG